MSSRTRPSALDVRLAVRQPASFTYAHRGAESRSDLPARLSPRRTRRVLGIRATPKAHEGFIGGLAVSVILVGSSDLPTRLMSALFGF